TSSTCHRMCRTRRSTPVRARRSNACYAAATAQPWPSTWTSSRSKSPSRCCGSTLRIRAVRYRTWAATRIPQAEQFSLTDVTFAYRQLSSFAATTATKERGISGMDSDIETQAPGNAGAPSPWRERLLRISTLVPTVAVVSVVVTALAATVVVTRPDWQNASRPAVISKTDQEVVKAPPLVVKAPPTDAAIRRSKALGAGPACRNCGVVESVALAS